jgi:hypothetical protein
MVASAYVVVIVGKWLALMLVSGYWCCYTTTIVGEWILLMLLFTMAMITMIANNSSLMT